MCVCCLWSRGYLFVVDTLLVNCGLAPLGRSWALALPAPPCSHCPPRHLPLFPVCPHQRPALVLIGGWGARSESEPGPETPAVAGAGKAWPHPHRHPSWFSAPFTSTWLLSRPRPPSHAHAQAHTHQVWSEVTQPSHIQSEQPESLVQPSGSLTRPSSSGGLPPGAPRDARPRASSLPPCMS